MAVINGGLEFPTDDSGENQQLGLYDPATKGFWHPQQAELLTLTNATPVPTNSDITNISGTGIVAADHAIRNTSVHTWVIPMKGWRRATIGLYLPTQYDQALTCYLIGSNTVAANGSALLLNAAVPASTTVHMTIGEGAVGQGGTAGGATAGVNVHYSVPAMNAGFLYLILYLFAAVSPGAGLHELYIHRTGV